MSTGSHMAKGQGTTSGDFFHLAETRSLLMLLLHTQGNWFTSE